MDASDRNTGRHKSGFLYHYRCIHIHACAFIYANRQPTIVHQRHSCTSFYAFPVTTSETSLLYVLISSAIVVIYIATFRDSKIIYSDQKV